jgi:hypothetical protein
MTDEAISPLHPAHDRTIRIPQRKPGKATFA